MKSICSCLSLSALFEEEFCIDWIIDISGHKPSHVFTQFENAVLQGWLLKKKDGFFTFKDEATQKEIEENLSPEDRQLIHKKIAEYFAKEFPANVQFQTRIANQLLFDRNDLTGCRLLLEAADYARRNHSYKEASTYYQKIMDDLDENSERECITLFVDAAIKYARISFGRENTNLVSSYLERAILIANENNLPEERSLLLMHLAKNDYISGKYHLALEHIREGWSIIEKVENSKFVSSAIAFRFYADSWQGLLNKIIKDYEQETSMIERFPSERHRILTAGMVGYCYTLTGQVTQGLGMLNALHKHCSELNDQVLADDIDITIAIAMLDLGRIDEALSYLEGYEQCDINNSDWNTYRAKLILASAYFFKGKKEEAVHYFKQWLDLSAATNVNVLLFPFSWFEMCKAMDEGTFPRLSNINLEEEIAKHIKDENYAMRGIVYRYKALLQRKQNEPSEKIIESLIRSVESLLESGLVIELCRTYLELMQQYTSMGNPDDSEKIRAKISKLLENVNRDFIPEELRSFAREWTQDWPTLWDEILKLSQDMSSIRDPKELLQSILLTSNRISGAERGAIFSVENQQDALNSQATPKIALKASKNITSSDVDSYAFANAKKLIGEVALTGLGKIIKNAKTRVHDESNSEEILSQICVPMVMRNIVVGVLYLENHLLINPFNEHDLQFLSYFAAQAAIALDHAEAYAQIQLLNQKIDEEKKYYKEQSLPNLHLDSFIGKSSSILEVLNKINQVVNTDANVLILGETGVGKGLVAQAIHQHSKRKDQPFVKVLCTALPEHLISSELFGHERGAFTGSVQKRIGRFELADRGTIFLDEIGDLKEEIQTQLLQVIQSKEFERVGSSKTIRSDFRLITATNRDLVEAVKNKRFRADLYYRLNVFPIRVPPLREHKEDIPLLAHHFLDIFSKRTGKIFSGISKREMDKLTQYEWPGNVRELEGIIERGGILSAKDDFRVPDLDQEKYISIDPTSDSALKDNERSLILETLKKTNWKIRGEGGAADLLNINYSTLFFRMKKLGIQRPPDMPKGRKRIALNHT
ncbi:MAG: sigma 54-interacting transcriptional regulator [Deltaproteobacteria bacterium]